MGYEYGAKVRMDVVRGTPEDVEKPQWDISGWISEVNKCKKTIPVLQQEGIWRTLSDYNLPYIFLEKKSDDGKDRVFFCINKNLSYSTLVKEWMIPDEIRQCKKLIQINSSPSITEDIPGSFSLDPADIILVM